MEAFTKQLQSMLDSYPDITVEGLICSMSPPPVMSLEEVRRANRENRLMAHITSHPHMIVPMGFFSKEIDLSAGPEQVEPNTIVFGLDELTKLEMVGKRSYYVKPLKKRDLL